MLDSIVVGGDVTTFVPAGWLVDDGVASPDASGTSTWSIDDACQTPCGALSGAEWEQYLADNVFAPAMDGEGTVVADETSAVGDGQRRRLEVQTDGVVHVVIARWLDGGSGYILCELRGPSAELDLAVAVFDFACDNTRAALGGG